jgi:integrase
MKLTDSFIKRIKPEDTVKNYPDGNGLVLFSYPNGALSWRYRYRFGGKAKMLSLGSYPYVTLKSARESHTEMRRLLDKDIDPSSQRKERERLKALISENSFKAIALKWHETWAVGKEPSHVKRILNRLEANVFKEIGHLPINAITAPILVAMVKKIESGKNRPLEIAKRAYSTCGQVFRFAIAHGLCERNPVADVRISDVVANKPVQHRTRIDPRDFPELLRKIDAYDVDFQGNEVTRLALQLMTLTFLRTSELIGARWDEIDINKKEWRIPATRMKMRDPHIIHLSPQSIKIFERLHEITGGGSLVFPHESNPLKSMSNNTILFSLYRMGYHGRMTGHGFRGLASTTLHEQGYPHEHIELQLAHSERDSVSAAYNFATYLPQRARMLDDWANYLDGIKSSAKVIGIRSKAR